MTRRILISTVVLVVTTTAFAQNRPTIQVDSLITGLGAADLPTSTVIVDIHHTVLGLVHYWTSAGISAATLNGARFVYVADPNGGNLLTHPDQDGGVLTAEEKYSTFVSKPRDQFNNPRFRASGEARIIGGYIPNAPDPSSSDFDFNVVWADVPPSGLETSGWTSRLSIDISGVFDLAGPDARNRNSYVRIASAAPIRPGDQLICTISAAVATNEFANPVTTPAFNVWLDRPPFRGRRAVGR